MNVPVQEIWVRHGPTHQKAFTGWRDVPADLSDTEALARLEAALPDVPIVSSDLIRARATADAVQGSRRRLSDEPGLREFNFGDWDGRHWSDVSAEDPDLSLAYWETPGTVAPPGGESWNEAATRVSAVVDRLVATHGTIVFVAHMGVIMTRIQAVTACSAYDACGHDLQPLSMTLLPLGPDEPQIGLVL